MKTLLIFLSFLCLSSLPIAAQEEAMEMPETMPIFPGGTEAMYLFVFKNVKYPTACRKERISGKVIVRFVVDTTGYIEDPKIMRGVDSACGINEEALRVVNSMNELAGRWTPGTNKGKNVRAEFTLPFTFKLD